MTAPRFIAILVGLLLAALALALLYLHYGDMSRHKQSIENLVSETMGREFKIEGNIGLRLWPATSLTLEGLTLANAEWSEEPRMLRVGHLAAYVSPISLLSGPMRIESFSLREVEVLVESNEDGASNWALAESGTPAEPAPDPVPDPETTTTTQESEEDLVLPITLDELEIADILVTLRQPGQEDRLIRLDQLDLTGGEQNLELLGRGEILSHDLALTGTLGPREQLATLGAVELDMAGSLGALALELRGWTDQLETLAAPRLEVVLKSDDVADLAGMAGAELPFNGPLAVDVELTRADGATLVNTEASLAGVETSSRVTLREDRIELDQTLRSLASVGTLLALEGLPDEPLTLTGTAVPGDTSTMLEGWVATAAGAEFRISGELASGEGDSTLQLTGKAASLRGVLASLPDLPLDLKTTLGLTTEYLTVEGLEVAIGDSDLAGEVRLGLGDAPDITADLKSRLLDLDQLLPDQPEPEGEATPTEPQAAPAPTGESPEAEAAPAELVFRDTPLPFEQLLEARLDIKLAVDQVKNTGATGKNFRVQVTGADGDITARSGVRGSHGGTVANRLELKATGDNATIDALVQVRGMHLNILSEGVEDPKLIPANDLTFKLTTAGASPRQMAVAANGQLLFTQGPGKVRNGILGAVSGDTVGQLVSALNPFAQAQPFSNWECSLVVLNIGEAKAALDQMIFQGEQVMIVAGGVIDLETEKIRIEFNTRPRKGVGVSADMFVKPFVALRGTLASPGIGLNETSTLMTAGAAVATGGLSILIKAAADRLGGNVNHCEKTLPSHPQPPMVEVF